MSTISKLLLLADVAVLVFVRIRVEHEWVFWLLAGMIIPLTLLLYLTTYHISRRQALKALGSTNAAVLPSASYVPSRALETSSQSNSFGRLAVTEKNIVLLSRQKDKIKEIVSIPISDISEFAVGKVLPGRPGITFTLQDESTRQFSVLRAGELRNQLMQALGWEEASDTHSL
ncbi:MAG: hypothetical protein HQ557_00385 [Bacteroidetes bacterium]|nr:hypothetical protein [Bacteroidota bacterium]